MKYSIATNWDDKLITYFKRLNFLYEDKVIELFGSLPLACAVPAPEISKPKIEEKIKLIKKAGFRFNYLINFSVFPDLNSKKGQRKTMEYIYWIETQKVDIVTVADKNLLSLICKYFPELKINISIVLGIKTIKEVNLLRKRYPNIERITLHQTINRNKHKLIQHIANAHQEKGLKPVKVELLANEICLYNCPLMKKHYAYSSRTSQFNKEFKPIKGPDKFEISCSKIRAKNPLQFLNACWIRPEDVEIYENLGVDILKIAGKTDSTDYLFNTTKSYMERSRKGNVMNLFSSDWWPQKEKPYVDNSQLNGFVEYLWSKNLNQARVKSLPPKYKIKYLYDNN